MCLDSPWMPSLYWIWSPNDRNIEVSSTHNTSKRRLGAGHEDRKRTFTGGEAYTTHVKSTRAQRVARLQNEGGLMRTVLPGQSG